MFKISPKLSFDRQWQVSSVCGLSDYGIGWLHAGPQPTFIAPSAREGLRRTGGYAFPAGFKAYCVALALEGKAMMNLTPPETFSTRIVPFIPSTYRRAENRPSPMCSDAPLCVVKP